MKQIFAVTLLATALFSHSPDTNAKISALPVTSKPNITVLATGGTIAGSSTSTTDTTDYKAGSLGIDILLQAVPELSQVAVISGQQVSNIDSNNVTSALLLDISKKVNLLLSDDQQQGVVITHGTDTMEESAFFMDLTVNSSKPVVFVGAMRPATAISADGPMNLLEAVTLAADKQAHNRGTLVVLNDRIGSAFYITKSNSTMVDTFKSVEQGYLGAFISGQPKFYYAATMPTAKPYFDISKVESLPQVDIIYTHQDQNGDLIKLAVEKGAKGIVVAGSGNGNTSKPMENAMKEMMAQGVPVIVSTRTGSGFVTPKPFAISSGIYNPQKSRILLMLALAKEANIDEIRYYFED